MARRGKEVLVYTGVLAVDLKSVAKATGIPVKFLYLWKETWLSYPITAEDFRILSIISDYVWGDVKCMRQQLSDWTRAERLKLINDCEVPLPIAMLRNMVLEAYLSGRRCPPTRVLIDAVRGRYWNGYQLINANVIRSAKRWARQMALRAENDPELKVMLEKSLSKRVESSENTTDDD